MTPKHMIQSNTETNRLMYETASNNTNMQGGVRFGRTQRIEPRELSADINEIADNMVITPERSKSRSPRMGGKDRGRLVMQVNKYIPHYQRIPAKLKKADWKRFEEDYF
jgi:hypothetical protein